MTGLLKHCLDFVIKYHALKLYPYSGITKKNGKTFLYTDWVNSLKYIIKTHKNLFLYEIVRKN